MIKRKSRDLKMLFRIQNTYSAVCDNTINKYTSEGAIEILNYILGVVSAAP